MQSHAHIQLTSINNVCCVRISKQSKGLLEEDLLILTGTEERDVHLMEVGLSKHMGSTALQASLAARRLTV